MSCKLGCWVISPTTNFKHRPTAEFSKSCHKKTETDSTRFFVGKAYLGLSLMALDLISMASWVKFYWQSCGSHALGSCAGYTAGEGKSGRYNLLRLVVNIPVFLQGIWYISGVSWDVWSLNSQHNQVLTAVFVFTLWILGPFWPNISLLKIPLLSRWFSFFKRGMWDIFFLELKSKKSTCSHP